MTQRGSSRPKDFRVRGIPHKQTLSVLSEEWTYVTVCSGCCPGVVGAVGPADGPARADFFIDRCYSAHSGSAVKAMVSQRSWLSPPIAAPTSSRMLSHSSIVLEGKFFGTMKYNSACIARPTFAT